MDSVVVPMFGLPIMRDKNVIMTVTGSASQMRGSGYLPRQAAVSWVQTNRSEQEFSVLKNL